MTAKEWFIRGNELRSKDKEQAIKAYEQAIALEPSMDEAYFNRALTYSELGRDKEAVADSEVLSERKSALAPKLRGLFAAVSDASVDIGNGAWESGNYDLASAKYTAALIYNPKSADAHIGLGLVFSKTKKPQDAIAEYGRAIQLNPKSAIAYHNRGEAFLLQSDFKKATEDFTKAIELEPDEPSAYSGRAQAFEGLGDKESAEKDREAALRLKANPKKKTEPK